MLRHPSIHTCVPQVHTGQVSQEIADQQVLDKDPAHRLVVVDGAVSAQLSSAAQLPEGVFIGSLQDAFDQATVDSLVSHGILLYRIGPRSVSGAVRTASVYCNHGDIKSGFAPNCSRGMSSMESLCFVSSHLTQGTCSSCWIKFNCSISRSTIALCIVLMLAVRHQSLTDFTAHALPVFRT